MPIYAYRCEACGHEQDVLQKLSDAPLTVCTSCGAAAFRKQVTAAGFQLKGSGWYVTDFRDKGGSGGGAKKAEKAESASNDAAKGDSAPAAEKQSDSVAKSESPGTSGGGTAAAS